jgi:putative ABC transport system permease protein
MSLKGALLNSLRSLARTPVFLFTVVASLALGIGTTSTVVAALVTTLSESGRFVGSDQVFAVGIRSGAASASATNQTSWQIDSDEITRWEGAASIVAVARYSSIAGVIEGGSEPEFRQGAATSAGLLSLLGRRLLAGRWFTADDARAPVIVIDARIWRTQFANDTAVIGQTVLLNGEARTVIGVAEAGELLPTSAGFWIPAERGDGNVVIRTRPGTTRAQVAAELDASSSWVANLRRAGYKASIVAEPLDERLFGPVRHVLILLAIAASLLLLVSATNVVNLSVARLLKKEREFAVRIALGASRVVVATSLGIETLILCGCAACAAGLMAHWTARGLAFIAAVDPSALRPLEYRSSTVLATTGGATCIAAVICGLAPLLALLNRRWALPSSLGNAQASSSPAFFRIRRSLIAIQLCLATLLLTNAAATIRAISRLSGSQLGFRAENVVVSSVHLFGSKYRDPQTVREFVASVVGRMLALPQVTSVAVGPAPLIAGREGSVHEGFTSIFTYRDPTRNTGPVTNVWVKSISPGYVMTYGLSILTGRDIETGDSQTAEPVALLNASAATLFFPNSSGLGRSLPVALGPNHLHPRVVGIVKDARQRDPTIEAVPEVFVPTAQSPPMTTATIAVRTAGSPATIKTMLRSTIRAIDPRLSPMRLQTMDEIVSTALARQIFVRQLLLILAVIVTLVSAVGVYGIVSYVVVQRAGEFGIRSALGAAPMRIIRDVLADAAELVAVGVASGMAVGIGVNWAVASRVAGLARFDIVAFVAGPVVLATIAMLAAYRPAQHASRVDPVLALRGD